MDNASFMQPDDARDRLITDPTMPVISGRRCELFWLMIEMERSGQDYGGVEWRFDELVPPGCVMVIDRRPRQYVFQMKRSPVSTYDIYRLPEVTPCRTTPPEASPPNP